MDWCVSPSLARLRSGKGHLQSGRAVRHVLQVKGGAAKRRAGGMDETAIMLLGYRIEYSSISVGSGGAIESSAIVI